MGVRIWRCRVIHVPIVAQPHVVPELVRKAQISYRAHLLDNVEAQRLEAARYARHQPRDATVGRSWGGRHKRDEIGSIRVAQRSDTAKGSCAVRDIPQVDADIAGLHVTHFRSVRQSKPLNDVAVRVGRVGHAYRVCDESIYCGCSPGCCSCGRRCTTMMSMNEALSP